MFDELVKRGRAQAARLGEQAASVATELMRDGHPLPTVQDVVKYGAGLARGSHSASKTVTPMARGTSISQGIRNQMDRSPVAKKIAGAVALNAGWAPGAARGAWHLAKDVAGAAELAGRLANPLDRILSAPGEAATDQVVAGELNLLGGVVDAASHPRATLDKLGDFAREANVRLNPAATPLGGTLVDEVKRQFEIGLNQGELGFNAASFAYGGGEAKVAMGLGRAAKLAGPEKFLARGMPPGLANYFASPYPKSGMGHHYWPRSRNLPAILGGGPMPQFLLDSPLLVLKPSKISRGDMFELHVGVDPKYWGGKVRTEFGGGSWSAKKLGWKKYGPAGRLWHGAPGPLKATVGGAGLLGAGAVVDQLGGHGDLR